ncbi:MAG: hypothetical protein HY042_03370 [Spirochaetia bacterium]|nr:hypothetical protein [Spirochaetia bacterium]
MRVATITPEITKVPRLQISGFTLDTLKADPRRAHYDLTRDDTRSIVYAVDPDYDVDLYQRLTEL